MGNDGGDIPTRKELVRDKKKVQVATQQSKAMGRARFCNLTKRPLKEPLAICRLGNIYNYENVLQALVKKQLPSKYAYIKKRKDIKEIKIDRTIEGSQNYIACPTTKIEYNGFNKFVAFWKCGHVVSRKALKELKNQENVCIICQTPYETKDLIDLNLQDEELVYYRKKLIQQATKKEKKVQQQDDVKDQLKKKVKRDFHVNSIDRLDDEFRDTIRNRNNFKDLFKNEGVPDWKKNTYFIDKGQAKQQTHQ